MNNTKDKQSKKIRYDAAYISYVESGESAAVFITRDLVNAIPTGGKWIDILSIQNARSENGRWNFKSFDVEVFPRTIQPEYPKNASKEETNYITWATARKDIEAQRRKGVKGAKYKVFPKLTNRNAGKYTIRKSAWNKTFNQWVPDAWFGSSCEWRKPKNTIESQMGVRNC